MHIDFAPPSKGTYNNSGSCRALARYMEHDDLERMGKGIYTDGFFNLTADNIYKSAVIKDIDKNIGQLLKTDAKFYAIHISPSEDEIQAMGTTQQEQAEAMKRYIREVFIPEYAKNFNKGLSAEDIKFYGKIHFDRESSDNEQNLHCHLIVSRKDQTNKKKLSPLTNHKNTQKGTVTGGFDRVNLFQQAEQGFDKLFSYNRQQTESFDYHNTMKNGSISEQLHLQEQIINSSEIKKETQQPCKQETLLADIPENKVTDKPVYNSENHKTAKQSYNPPENERSLGSLISFTSSGADYLPDENRTDEELRKLKRRKRKRGKRM